MTVLCPLASLPYDRYELGRDGVRLVGAHSGRAYALGDRVRVRIEDISLARRKVIAVPIAEGGGRPRTPIAAHMPKHGAAPRAARGRPQPTGDPRTTESGCRAARPPGARPASKRTPARFKPRHR